MFQDFKYLTEKFRIDETQLNEAQLMSRCFHLICSPRRCIDLVQGVLARRQAIQAKSIVSDVTKPVFVWEPVPDCCRPEELENTMQALKYVDVISPNHQELSTLFGSFDVGVDREQSDVNMERECRELLSSGFGKRRGVVVVRCGERGCAIVIDDGITRIPAYHQVPAVGSGEKVVDPTGAGNAFLGGFCVGLLDHTSCKDKYMEGVIYGTIAASFAVEQVGLPKLGHAGDQELWNGESALYRLENFRASLQIMGKSW